VPRPCEFYPGSSLTTEEKAWKNLSQGKKFLYWRLNDRTMNLTTHLHTLPTLNEWSYTSNSSTCPHGVDRETLHFTAHPNQEGCDFRVFQGLWCVGEQAAV